MSDPFSIAMVIVGTGFMLLGTLGVLRMPDVYMRLQVASKASSLGAGCLMLGVATHFGDVGIVVRAILVVIFIFLTTPVSAHLIGRAAYITGVPLWEGTGEDELRDAYDAERGTLRGARVDDEEAAGEQAEEAQPAMTADPDATQAKDEDESSGAQATGNAT